MNRSIVVMETPIPNARHRTGRGREYTPTATLEMRHRIKMAWLKAHGTKSERGPVRLDVQVILPRPLGHYGTGRNAGQLKPSAPARPIGRKGDWDNFGKLVSDALNGTAFVDDGQIVDARVRKWYVEDGDISGWAITVADMDHARAMGSI